MPLPPRRLRTEARFPKSPLLPHRVSAMPAAAPPATIDFTLPVHDLLLRGVVHLPPHTPAPWVITCHGLFSSSASEKFTAIADACTRVGIAVIRFDFSGCGASTGSIAGTTPTGRYEQLQAVLTYGETLDFLRGRPGLMGSSLGGFLALRCAAEDRIAVVSVWAAPVQLMGLEGALPAEDRARLAPEFFRDAATCTLDPLLDRIGRVQIIHGQADVVVPWQHAEKIHASVQEPRQLLLLPTADHAITDPDDRHLAVQACAAWLSRFLIESPFTFS